jgi:hypothetical protein
MSKNTLADPPWPPSAVASLAMAFFAASASKGANSTQGK